VYDFTYKKVSKTNSILKINYNSYNPRISDSWKKRNIAKVSISPCWISNGVNEKEAYARKVTRVLLSVLSEYHIKEIFSGDECGWFSSLLWYKIYVVEDEICCVSTRNKHKITALVSSNMNRSEKMSRLVTRKSDKPSSQHVHKT
jgi:hypothetical protein